MKIILFIIINYIDKHNIPKSLKTRYQIINNTKIPKNKTVILTENNELTLIR